jgi:hypothetical protein
MDEKSKYYHIRNSKKHFILDDRIEINWIEILLYPSAIFLFLFFGTGNLIIAIPITILVGLFYTIFRYLAWFFYSELTINKTDGSVMLINKFIDKVRSTDLIDKTFQLDKVEFKKQERSGKTKYLLTYQTHKQNDIMVVKSEEHKLIIENGLKNIN